MFSQSPNVDTGLLVKFVLKVFQTLRQAQLHNQFVEPQQISQIKFHETPINKNEVVKTNVSLDIT